MAETPTMDDERIEAWKWAKMVGRGLTFTIIFLVLLIWAWRLVSPQLTLYQANVEKRVLVAEAKAKAEAATDLAEVDRRRAQGVADANGIIAASLTPEYVEWLYVDQLDDIAAQGGSQIIYIPTEGGIPILEAGRSVAAEAAATDE